MTKDLTERRYFIFLKRPADAIYMTFGELKYRHSDWQFDLETFNIRPYVDQEVPDTYCFIFGTQPAEDKT